MLFFARIIDTLFRFEPVTGLLVTVILPDLKHMLILDHVDLSIRNAICLHFIVDTMPCH